ncbi:hypothetical protein D9757_010165 [Collybiopsis confluens]|uniref:RNA polymerase II-associated protein n=1 Tax=Collybiopsis confluens TaxID=2823264 RepID=A0A8H5LYU4_9AGAR|nr:hypothetical protein D9757_010165 [Collybiopsis confluens]
MDIDEEVVPPGRSVDIELGGQEVITIDLDNLEPDPEDLLELLRESKCKVWVWTKLAGEYWRKGYVAAAERIANSAIDSFKSTGNSGSLPPIYSLLANIQIDHSRKAPKLILPTAREDVVTGQKSKEDYHKEAATLINAAQRAAAESEDQASGMELAFLTRGIQQLATRNMDEAMRSFDGVLAKKPTNLVALLGKGRILYLRRNYPQALQNFQQVLRYNPHCNPDPRIGIGLCFWSMNNKAKAKAAWERSLELNPSEWTVQLLLGLESVNASKDSHLTEEERTQLILTGTKMIERAFKANQKNASAANALCEIFIQKGSFKQALKLAERTMQFADTLTVLTEGYVRAGRVSHAEGNVLAATRYYTLATEGQPKHVLAAIGLAQMQMQNDELGGAINTLDNLLQSPNPQKSLEASVMLASLRASSRPGITSAEMVEERIRARELFDRVSKSLEIEDSKANGHGPSKTSRMISQDMNMHLEIGRLWQEENIARTTSALQEALQINQTLGKLEPRLLNNLGALHHSEAKLPEAREFYEAALTGSIGAENADTISTSILYNLARVYEDQGEEEKAKDAYEKLLSRHPEYVDAKVRQAQLLHNVNRNNEAHELIKESLVSQSSNLNLRAFYTYFLVQTNLTKNAKEFVFTTLKDYDKHDIYSLCAAAWIHYHQARESRDSSSKGTESRRKNFQRSAEFYEKALQLDPFCAFAAQGLAIVTAEDALGVLSGVTPSSSADEAQRRIKNTGDALDVFAKVRESLNDGSVYLNMGHCYYARDEFDRAIESYETASGRFYNRQNVPVLLCLCRSWYAKAMKDQSYSSIKTALEYAQKALHIQPNDKAIVYNIAMIQQKSAEMLFSLPPAKRTLKDLERVIEMAQHALKLFGALASDKSQQVPYSRDIADQRRKYGENMLRKKDEHLSAQTQHEGETQARLDAARQMRQEEKQRVEALEREKMETLRRDAEKLAQERRLAREQALEWTREARINESDEEKEKRQKKSKKAKGDGVASGDEGEAPKKKRRGKIKKANGEPAEDGEEAAVFSDEDDAERPAKKQRQKKRVIRDDDEEEIQTGPRKKQFKSKEVLSDTDDEMEG